MARPFHGVWGSFEHIDEATAVIRALRGEGRDYSVLSPFYHHELHHAMGEPQSRVPFVTLVFGAMGVFFGYALPSWTALDWVLPVSSKPIVSIPPFTIIAFELMVLLGGLSTALGIAVFSIFSMRRARLPRSKAFKNYGRFSRDRFGVVVRCALGEAERVERLMREHSAEEVVREF
jgi:molybdopterin-containing oxidoreductase family membrane subunit